MSITAIGNGNAVTDAAAAANDWSGMVTWIRSSFFPVAGFPCQPPPCRLGAPQPFTVLATTAIGSFPSLAAANASNAALIWAGSCPSIACPGIFAPAAASRVR